MPTTHIDAFLIASNYTPMKIGQAKKTLLAPIRVNGVLTTVHEFIESSVAAGLTLSTEQEDKIKPMSRMAYFRADNNQQAAHERKIKAAGKKTVRYIGGFEIGVFEYTYASYLIEKQSKVAVESECLECV